MLSPQVSLSDYLIDSPLGEYFPQAATHFQMSMTDIETSTPNTSDGAAVCRDSRCKQVDRDNKLEISSLHTKLSRYARIEAELCDKDLRIRELEAKVQKFERENAQLQRSKDEELQKERDDHAATKKELTAAQSRLDKQIQQHDEDLKESRKGFEDAISEKTAENQKLQAAVAAARRSILDTNDEFNQIKAELAAMKETKRQSDSQKDEELQRVKSSLVDANQATRNVDSLCKKEVLQLNNNLVTEKALVTKQSEQLQQRQKDLDAARREYVDLQKFHDNLVSEHRDLKAKHHDVEVRVDILTSRYDTVKSRYTNLTTQYGTLKSQNDELESQHEKALKECQADLCATQQRVLDTEARKKDEIEQAKAELELMSLTARSLQQQLDEVGSINNQTFEKIEDQIAQILSEASQASAQVRRSARVLEGEKLTREVGAKPQSQSASAITVQLFGDTETATNSSSCSAPESEATGHRGDVLEPSTPEPSEITGVAAKCATSTRGGISFSLRHTSSSSSLKRTADEQLAGTSEKKQKVAEVLASESGSPKPRTNSSNIRKWQQRAHECLIPRMSQR